MSGFVILSLTCREALPPDDSMQLLLGSLKYYEDDASKYWMEDAGMDEVAVYLLGSKSTTLSQELKSALGIA